MIERQSIREFLTGPEDLHRRELEWGMVREPPAPRFGHQSVVTRVTVILDRFVRTLGLGQVCVSPIDVVLDRDNGLVVQPDVIYISNERRSIIRGQVWGPPDLVVEVASQRTAVRDRTTKLRWYRDYAVRECWLVDPSRREVVVVNFEEHTRKSVRRFKADQVVRSRVLPEVFAEAAQFFG